jgi:hypothetical protein
MPPALSHPKLNTSTYVTVAPHPNACHQTIPSWYKHSSTFGTKNSTHLSPSSPFPITNAKKRKAQKSQNEIQNYHYVKPQKAQLLIQTNFVLASTTDQQAPSSSRSRSRSRPSSPRTHIGLGSGSGIAETDETRRVRRMVKKTYTCW